MLLPAAQGHRRFRTAACQAGGTAEGSLRSGASGAARGPLQCEALPALCPPPPPPQPPFSAPLSSLPAVPSHPDQQDVVGHLKHVALRGGGHLLGPPPGQPQAPALGRAGRARAVLGVLRRLAHLPAGVHSRGVGGQEARGRRGSGSRRHGVADRPISTSTTTTFHTAALGRHTPLPRLPGTCPRRSG
jgi:hypothetical protein